MSVIVFNVSYFFLNIGHNLTRYERSYNPIEFWDRLLDDLKRNITDAYSKGKINEKHYERLNKEISMFYEEIFRNRIESIANSPKNTISKQQLYKISEEIEIAYSKEKITETQFELLNKKIKENTLD